MNKSKIKERDIAIKFAMWLMNQEVTVCRGVVDGKPIERSYMPREYSLMKGNLIQNGYEMFSDFAVNELINNTINE